MVCRFTISRIARFVRGHYTMRSKTLLVTAASFGDAYDYIRHTYPGWSINNAWPLWPQPKVER